MLYWKKICLQTAFHRHTLWTEKMALNSYRLEIEKVLFDICILLIQSYHTDTYIYLRWLYTCLSWNELILTYLQSTSASHSKSMLVNRFDGIFDAINCFVEYKVFWNTANNRSQEIDFMYSQRVNFFIRIQIAFKFPYV